MRFLKGFALGIVLGGLLAWVYQHYFWPRPETVLDQPRPRVRPAPAVQVPDDLVALRGVGPAFAQCLQQAGIRTYADLARMTPEELAERCQGPVWRIRRDDWIGQAAARVK